MSYPNLKLSMPLTGQGRLVAAGVLVFAWQIFEADSAENSAFGL
jgi:hypothetical protein